MTEAIIVAIVALIGQVIIGYLSNRKSTAIIVYRIDNLEKKVEKHNQVIERTYNLEKSCAVFEREFASVNARLKKLEPKKEREDL